MRRRPGSGARRRARNAQPSGRGRLATAVHAAICEAAGLDGALEEGPAELLRFVTRMAAATERRDLLEPGSGPGPGAPAGAGVAFPPLKRRIRPIPPDKAAAAWLARFRALAGAAAPGRTDGTGAEPAGAGAPE